MQKKVIVSNGVNVRTKMYGSSNGDFFSMAELHGRTLHRGIRSHSIWSITLTDMKRKKRYTLDFSLKLIIGRDPDAQGVKLCLPMDSMVSKNHAMIMGGENGISISDLNSRNQTYLNGQRVKDSAGLKPGDIIKVGMTKLMIEAYERKD